MPRPATTERQTRARERTPTDQRGITMSTTIAQLGRRLRLGVVGGGPGSFIGPVHRAAARLDDHFEVVAAVLGRDPERSRRAAQDLGIAPERAYDDHARLIAGEAARGDGID